MKLYNTLTKRVEDFKPQNSKNVKMYACGPTVYDYPTLGNLRTYINEDLLRRFLEFSGYTVKHVMNITDIEDKIIKRSKEQSLPYKNVTQKFEKAFFSNLRELDIEKPNIVPHATDKEVIEHIILIITRLFKKGFAYKSDDGSIYFSISKFKNYGKLSGVDLSGIKSGARVSQDEYGKENVQDFALWKAAKPDEPSWHAPFGAGRPGWHIECTAMSNKYLGDTIDIHAGAVDLLFPHHENEIAQSESFTGKKFVNYWFHAEHLLINGQRMAKSLNNFYVFDDLITKFKVEPLAFRLLCLMSSYREKLNFTDESIQQAQNTLNGLGDFVLKNYLSKAAGESTKDIRQVFLDTLNNDLNTPKALASLFDFIKVVNKNNGYGTNVYKFLIEIDKILGLNFSGIGKFDIPIEVEDLVIARQKARDNEDWSLADDIRNNIESLGYEIEDNADGPLLKKK